jgi:hypothetical protein
MLDNSFYKGPYGSVGQSGVTTLSHDRFKSMIINPEWGHPNYDDAAERRLKQLLEGAPYSMKRLVNLDSANPRQMFPPDFASLAQIDRIPDLREFKLDMEIPSDGKVSDQLLLVKNSFKSYVMQQNIFDPEKNVNPGEFTDGLRNQKDGGPRPMKNDELFSFDGSMAGMVTNRLDENGYRLNSVEMNVAF